MATVVVMTALHCTVAWSWHWHAPLWQADTCYDATMHTMLYSNSLWRFRGYIDWCVYLMRKWRNELLSRLFRDCIRPCWVWDSFKLGDLWVLADHRIALFGHLPGGGWWTFSNSYFLTANLKMPLVLRNYFKYLWRWRLLQYRLLVYLWNVGSDSLFETSATNTIFFVCFSRVLDKFSTSHIFIF